MIETRLYSFATFLNYRSGKTRDVNLGKRVLFRSFKNYELTIETIKTRAKSFTNHPEQTMQKKDHWSGAQKTLGSKRERL
jgi:hypothetical protein